MRLASRVMRDQHLIRGRPIWPREADLRRTAANTTIPVVRMTAGSPAHTDGSWVELVASTAVASSFIHMWSNLATFASNQDSSMLMDLAIGDGAGNPVSTVIEDWQIGFNIQSFQFGTHLAGYSMPLHIPHGVQLLGRIRSAIASDIADVALMLYGDAAQPILRICTTYGADPANSRGTVLTAPGAIHTKSAWTELSAAISQPIYAAGFGFGGAGASAFNAAGMFVDIGAGSAGNERIVIPDMYVTFSTSESIGTEDPRNRLTRSIDLPIGAGERLVARYQTNTLGQGVDLIVYGLS